MTLDWERPLVPRKRDLLRTCTCDRERTCEHVAAIGPKVGDRDLTEVLQRAYASFAESSRP